MAIKSYSGSIADATGLNTSPEVSLSGSGSVTGVVNSVYARLNFSTTAYGNTYPVIVTLYFSGGSKQSSRSVKMDSSNYRNAQFDFYFYGLTPEQANSIASVSAYCETNGGKIFLKGSQYAYVDYTVASKVGAPSSFYPSDTLTTNDSIVLYWSGATHGNANTISSY